jgi:hypothetical protein
MWYLFNCVCPPALLHVAQSRVNIYEKEKDARCPRAWDPACLAELTRDEIEDGATLLLPRAMLDFDTRLPVGPDGKAVLTLKRGEGACIWGPVIHAGACRAPP